MPYFAISLIPVRVLWEMKQETLEGKLRADLHGTTLTHATSLREAYDMTWDHFFTYKIKYAKVCTGIYGTKKF